MLILASAREQLEAVASALDPIRWDVTRVRGDGERAARTLAAGHHDVCVVFSDVGAAAITRLASHTCSQGADIPVIAIAEDAADEQVAIAAGAADVVLREAVSPALMSRVLSHALKLRDRERSLRRAQRRFALAIAGSSDGIWEWDRARERVFLSARWLELMGMRDIPEGEHELAVWLSRIHDADRSCFDRVLAAHLDGEAPSFECEYRALDGDGSYRWVRVRGIGERDVGGEVTRLSGSLTDIHSEKTSQLRYQHAALHDTLTGLPNRAYFKRQLRRVFREYTRGRTPLFAVLFLDLDRFKLINDSLGHEAGDLLLTSLSARLIPCVQAIDTIARVGGDEFSLLLERLTSEDDAHRVAEQIQRALEQPFVVEGHEVVMSCSIGIAFASRRYERAEHMLRDADNALFAAKGSGGAQFRIFSPDMHSRSVSMLKLESEMRRGIDAGEFELYYQPIVSLETRRIASLEALVRWNSPRRGMVSPGQFIPLAEDTGIILGLGRWVLREACRFGSKLVEIFGRGAAPPINVNVSRRQLRPAFVDEVLDTMDAFPLARDIIRFEITESALLREGNESGTLRAIRSMGIELHIDDFGTGYSSLASLASMEVSGLKIDRSFIERMDQDEKSAMIVETILSLARSLHMRVTAEGIETASQLRALERLDCAFGQGYLFARPMPGAKLIEQLLVDRDGEEPALAVVLAPTRAPRRAAAGAKDRVKE
ncbi:MAG: EAL domain-containing protein [Myxococcales bacterium]|nr:EAL domain-containing protein [Myxococcales bacterium]MCB9754067.1 EAL domain-containing protein [Myxococcales bacterium]